MKKLSEISWNVTEDEYRKDPALSYSTLSKYERLGFNGLPNLFDKLETPSLTFGSAVDSLITGGREEFDERFIVINMSKIPDEIKCMVKEIYNANISDFTCSGFNNVSDDELLKTLNEHKYRLNWKDSTRIKVLREQGSEYYNFLNIAKNKTILTQEDYNDVLKCVNVLKTSPQTKKYFSDDSNVDGYYQLKFKWTFNGVTYRIMADRIIVDHKNKIVYPIDLKTSSHYEWDFEESFIQYSYMIQARLYYRVIKAVMEADPYFKDFKLDLFRFIVVNRRSLIPLVWKFPYTDYQGSLIDSDHNVYRDPFEIGEELKYYLDNKPELPKGIDRVNDNILTCLKPYFLTKPII